MKILIVTHKDKVCFNNTIFRPIQVNSSLNKFIIDENYYSDNLGDSISEKNSNYCELTALYWMWKNLNNEKVLGLNHYRRYFNFLNNPIIQLHQIVNLKPNNKIIERHNIQKEKVNSRINKWLEKYDLILPYKQNIKIRKKFASVKDQYYYLHLKNDWDTLVSVIIEKFPEYEASIDKYLNKSNEIYIANIFVAKTDWLNKYCTWLFSILFELENRMIPSEDPYQKRVYGFMAERLLTLYVRHNNFKVKELQILYIE
jgi:hypothetical protein